MFILCYVPFMIALFQRIWHSKQEIQPQLSKQLKRLLWFYWCCQWWAKVGKEGVRLGCIWSVMWSIDASSYGRFFWFIVILIAEVFCDVDEKVIYNVSMQTIVGMTSLTLVLCALGILSDCLTYRTDFSTEARHSLGFVHSACLPLIVFYMMTYCISTNRNMKKQECFHLQEQSYIAFAKAEMQQ